MNDIRVAVPCDDPAKVALTLQRGLSIELKARDSSFWGAYWTELSHRRIRVFFNEDPMHAPGSDPPSEFYFEASVPHHRTLVDVEGDEAMCIRVAKVLAESYPDSRIVLDSSAGPITDSYGG